MYTKSDFINAIRSVDINAGDLVMVHCGLDRLGVIMEGVKSSDELSASIMDSLMEIIAHGTLVVPTFTYSFGSNEIFDPKTTPCPTMGQFSEYFWKQNGVHRSLDPFLSVAAKGSQAESITKIYASTSFGENSFFDRFTRMGGKILCIGVELRWATILHSYEEEFKVPHRYKKFFIGNIKDKNCIRKISWVYNVRPLCSNAYPTFKKIMEKCIEAGLVKSAPLGKGFVSSIKAQTYKEFAFKQFSKDPWITAVGPECDLIEKEKERTGFQYFNTILNDTSISSLVKNLYNLPRDIVSDGYDVALYALKSLYTNMKIYKFTSGYKAFEWIVPERWICKEAYLCKMNGELVFSTDQNPLHVMRYSLPFDGEVTYEELLKHLHMPNLKNSTDDEILCINKPYERTWGLCCTKKQIQSLKESRYKVKIDSLFSYGELKVGELEIQGQSDECILLCANLSSPYQFNNGLSGVIAGLKIIEALGKKKTYYSYKLVIAPEDVGFDCYFSRIDKNKEKIHLLVLLDNLASKNPLSITTSHKINPSLSSIIEYLSIKNDTFVYDFQTFTSDSYMFNEFKTRMIYFCRKLNFNNEKILCANYASSFDNLENVHLLNLEKSIDLVLELLFFYENDLKIKKLFSGNLFAENIDGIDYNKDKLFFNTFNCKDNELLSQIAKKNKCDLKELIRIAKILETAHLVELKR